MRISTTSFYTASLPAMQSQQSAIARLTQQIATDKNYLAPKDDPVATSRIMELSDSIALRNQYLANIQKAELALSEEETVLDEMHKALTDVQSLLYQISPSHDQARRDEIAQQLANLYIHIKDLANSKDSSGDYIFAGYQTDTLPFVHDEDYLTPDDAPTPPELSEVTTYAGDTGLRSVEIDAGRRVPINEILTNVFQVDAFDTADPDLLQAIDQAAIDLADPNIAQPMLQGNLDAYVGVVNTALDRMESTLNSVAGRMVELSDVKNTQESLKLTDQNALDEIQNLDETAAIVELQQRQVTLQASMQAFATVSELSLFNYL
jgi:flagellar hook-associated protein 3 FlgL